VYQRASHRTYFREVCYCGLARIFVEKIQVTLNVDTHLGASLVGALTSPVKL